MEKEIIWSRTAQNQLEKITLIYTKKPKVKISLTK